MTSDNFHFKKVLLVDDSEIDVLVNRRLIELTRFASEVVVTRSGEEGYHFLKEECRNESDAPDIIFLDMHLPMMSGYDFIEEFKNLPKFITSKTKIIILSVFQKQEKLEQALKNNFIGGQLEKPLTQQSLKELAESALLRVIVSS